MALSENEPLGANRDTYFYKPHQADLVEDLVGLGVKVEPKPYNLLEKLLRFFMHPRARLSELLTIKSTGFRVTVLKYLHARAT